MFFRSLFLMITRDVIMTDALRVQYEAYPYPARVPADEARRLITGSPSHLAEINHYLFGGCLDFQAPLRILFAGGGSGDGTIMLAQQLHDVGSPARITYLDLSEAARKIAEARAERRGLSNIEFFQGSLLEIEQHGLFDYIDCCGVLHHLEYPAAGLRSLVGALAPRGGIGLMVYAPYGRTGVYPLQAALRLITRDVEGQRPSSPAERVALTRRLLRHLPSTNWLRRNPIMGDHVISDAGLYDLLLHSQDRAYTVPELAQLVNEGGLAIKSFIEPARYQPQTYVRDPSLLKRLETLSFLEQAAWAEQICGATSKHIVYLTRPEDVACATVCLDDQPETLIPVPHGIDGPSLARQMPIGGILEAELEGLSLPISLPLPRLANALLSRIDGKTTLGELYKQLATIDGGKRTLSWETFFSQFCRLYEALNKVNKMLLRRSNVNNVNERKE
ncbi:Methyltransferase family protein [Azospirillaceae bacterium]